MGGKENSKADDENEAWRCTHKAILLNALGVWMASSIEEPDRNERTNKRMLAVMYRHLDLGDSLIVPDESLNETEKLEYSVMSSYINCHQCLYRFANANIIFVDFHSLVYQYREVNIYEIVARWFLVRFYS